MTTKQLFVYNLQVSWKWQSNCNLLRYRTECRRIKRYVFLWLFCPFNQRKWFQSSRRRKIMGDEWENGSANFIICWRRKKIVLFYFSFFSGWSQQNNRSTQCVPHIWVVSSTFLHRPQIASVKSEAIWIGPCKIEEN